MALKMCLKMDDKFVKFERDFAELGMAMTELQREYANLRAEMAEKDVQIDFQNALLKNEVTKLKEENRVLKCRLMNVKNGTNEDEQFYHQSKRTRLDILPIGGIVQELATGMEQQQVEITIAPQSLEGAINNEDENLEEHFLEFAAHDSNGIAIKMEEENANNDICASPREEQREIEQQIIQHRQNQNYYLANQMDESNDAPAADGFGQTKEEEAFGEEEEESGDYYKMEGNIDDLPGPSNIGKEIGQAKKKILKCQWTTKRRRLDYHEVKRFTDENAFEQWIQVNTDWTKQDNRGKQIQHYYCKFNKRKGYSCKARLRVFRPLHSSSSLIRVEQSDVRHTHEPAVILEGRMKLTEAAKKFIEEQLILGMRAQEIRNAFQHSYRDHPNDVPDLLQIQNQIQRIRKTNPHLARNTFYE